MKKSRKVGITFKSELLMIHIKYNYKYMDKEKDT